MTLARPTIPDAVRLKLWVVSGGRCEFPGCNKRVWRDGLTLKEDNFAHVAHIVGASKDGPRGDPKLSSKLATDFSNLMLVCLKHSKLVDGRNKKDYSVEYLREYKKRHEARIKMQTAVAPDMSTTVVRFIARVRERKMEISPSQAYEAIMPRFPADENGIALDFTNRSDSGGKGRWKLFASDVSTRIQNALASGNDNRRLDHFSVFAVAPIPLLVHLGLCIGGATPVDVFQKHRDTDDWKWKGEPKRSTFKYRIKRSGITRPGRKVALVLSLSGRIDPAEIAKVLPDAPRYEITIGQPSRDYLRHRSQLQEFAKVYRTLLTEIRERHGAECEISLFPAVPVAVAVTCGKELLPKADPRLRVYDLDNAQGGFVSTLTINYKSIT